MSGKPRVDSFILQWSVGLRIEPRMEYHRLGFVAYDTEDPRVVYSLFEVLNSRGLAVDWLDKTKSVLAYELDATAAAQQAELESLQTLGPRSTRR
jgi:hypothetical protein